MPLTISSANVISFTDSGQEFHLIAAIAPTGNYPAAGEPLLTGSATSGPIFAPEIVKVRPANYPKHVEMDTCPASGGGAVKYMWSYDKAAHKIKCFLGSTGVELVAGAYPADVTGGVTTIQAWFKKA